MRFPLACQAGMNSLMDSCTLDALALMSLGWTVLSCLTCNDKVFVLLNVDRSFFFSSPPSAEHRMKISLVKSLWCGNKWRRCKRSAVTTSISFGFVDRVANYCCKVKVMKKSQTLVCDSVSLFHPVHLCSVFGGTFLFFFCTVALRTEEYS